MGPGRRLYRTGLLIMKKQILTLTLFILIVLHGNTQEENLMVTTNISPDVLTRNSPIIITFVIDYPVLNDVEVIAPQLADFLMLDRMVKYARIIESRVHTIIEYRIIANRSGRFTLEPFSVVTPTGTWETEMFVLNVRNPEEQRLAALPFRWEAPPQITTGERVTLILRSDSWNSPQPPSSFFMPEVPQRVILSSSPVSPQERASGIAIKLTLIPLEAGDFVLPARILQHAGSRFEIPALRIRVTSREQ
jgi:hypothetical protein